MYWMEKVISSPITRMIEQGKPCISFIDEILKGTNTIERNSASLR
ncbi:hypothetical protein ACFQ38_08400 [Sporosarcina contaminans]|uniref:Uncharacterized protein n=1 Tax=Sporosarcina contaminans TaxID=633403 RepID=A0ABW3U0M4_9BACL